MRVAYVPFRKMVNGFRCLQNHIKHGRVKKVVKHNNFINKIIRFQAIVRGILARRHHQVFLCLAHLVIKTFIKGIKILRWRKNRAALRIQSWLRMLISIQVVRTMKRKKKATKKFNRVGSFLKQKVNYRKLLEQETDKQSLFFTHTNSHIVSLLHTFSLSTLSNPYNPCISKNISVTIKIYYS